jgi:hypothetical protein
VVNVLQRARASSEKAQKESAQQVHRIGTKGTCAGTEKDAREKGRGKRVDRERGGFKCRAKQREERKTETSKRFLRLRADEVIRDNDFWMLLQAIELGLSVYFTADLDKLLKSTKAASPDG